jgi:hypothetical protein
LRSQAWRQVNAVDRAARNVAGVVDQDIDLADLGRQALDVAWIAQVRRVSGGVDALVAREPVCERLERRPVAGDEDEVAAFLSERRGRGRADAFRGPGDHHPAADQS